MYRVQRILDKKKMKARDATGQLTGNPITHYLVEWKGYKGEDTYEPLSNLQDPAVKKLISEFNQRAEKSTATSGALGGARGGRGGRARGGRGGRGGPGMGAGIGPTDSNGALLAFSL